MKAEGTRKRSRCPEELRLAAQEMKAEGAQEEKPLPRGAETGSGGDEGREMETQCPHGGKAVVGCRTCSGQSCIYRPSVLHLAAGDWLVEKAPSCPRLQDNDGGPRTGKAGLSSRGQRGSEGDPQLPFSFSTCAIFTLEVIRDDPLLDYSSFILGCGYLRRVLVH
ncbi:hypothetical protein NDU88_000310 [Pleurodeles waltl]|uniref:Uncharacterized protein n=1 Tax=Pleurodeles waltl TaxID=8319 RepID=A0AAV7R7V7_PLEWA|nr:hypothetical protein NDU88_000310 [Pleurodeles waltl]